MQEENKIGLDHAYEQVKEFQKTFNQPAPDNLQLLNTQRYINRSVWTLEEIVEGVHALVGDADSFEFKKAINDLASGLLNAAIKAEKSGVKFETVEDKQVALCDAMNDTLYFAVGTCVEMGFRPQQTFDVVQKANMAKLWPDGQPRYREDGKILKPEGWVAPDDKIRQIIVEQLKN